MLRDSWRQNGRSLLPKKCPTIRKVHFACITENGQSNDFAVMPQWKLVTCWNHIVTDIEFWLKKHGAAAAEIVVYKNQVYELLKCETPAFLSSKLDTLRQTWSDTFVQYFDSRIHKQIEMAYVGYLHKCGLEGSAVTTNTSESMNAMLKRFQVSSVTIFVVYSCSLVVCTAALIC